MKNLILFIFLVFTISGLLTPSTFPSSFATPEDAPGRDKGTKTANGCDNGTAKNNPNCDSSNGSEPFTRCDTHEPIGVIDVEDVYQWLNDQDYLISLTDALAFINYIESLTTDPNDGVINTTIELQEYNVFLNIIGSDQCR